ncbi:MAG: FAD-dependent oxidoreductase [Rhodospirillales bacterium]|nr:MAG: FAD-dependent oxidoreductase [Rhodospirillales bacterium]
MAAGDDAGGAKSARVAGTDAPAAVARKRLDVDICVIGGGSGGLVVAAGAAQLGLDTVLLERGKMGGDCLNYGCVPSKALIAAAHAAQQAREAKRFGVDAGEPRIDFGAVIDHVHGVIAAIEPNDSVARFEGLGVRVIAESGRFTSPDEVTAGDFVIRARKFVVATGSRAVAPPIPGLADTPYLTNETLFENRALPEHLLVIGGGPIGLEMAQAFRRLGARVTVLEAARVMAKDDPELVAIAVARLKREGVEIVEGARIASVARDGAGVVVTLDASQGQRRIAGSHLLVAAGRAPNIDGLGLDIAGVATDKRGIVTDRRLRTSNRRVYAVGDVNGRAPFTHMAAAQAATVIKHALFRVPADIDKVAAPWCTYTEPELAQVGLSEAQARERHGERIKVMRWHLADNDRAQAERATEGMIKVVVDRKGRVLGAGIAAARAGDLIAPWCVAVSRGLKIGAMAQAVVPYPTVGEIGKRAAGAYYTETLFSDRTRRLVRFLFRTWPLTLL